MPVDFTIHSIELKRLAHVYKQFSFFELPLRHAFVSLSLHVNTTPKINHVLQHVFSSIVPCRKYFPLLFATSHIFTNFKS